MAGILLLGAPAYPFSNGKTQMGLNFLGQSGSGDFPFMDLMKAQQGWAYVDNSDQPTPDELDTNGWPLSTSTGLVSKGGVYGTTYSPTQAQRPGNYVCNWTGNGTIYIGTNNTLVSGSKTSTLGTGRYVFSTTASLHNIGIVSGSITNLSMCHVDDEVDLLTNGKMFNTQFLNTLRSCNLGVIRFLDWLHGNRTAVTDWDSRKPITYHSYATPEKRKAIYAGVTSGSGDNFEIASVPADYVYGDAASYTDKQYAIVKFDRNATTTSVTFKIGSGSAKPVLRYTAQALTTNSRPKILLTALMVFDATLDSWLKFGGDENDGYASLMNYVPPEICVRLAKELGAHPYFTLPYLAADPLSDWVSSLATYIRDTQQSWMIPRFEGVNELWHSSNVTEFPGSSYSWAKNNVRNSTASGNQTATGCTFDFSGGTGTSGTSTITFSAPHPFGIGAAVTLNSFVGTNFFGMNGQTAHVIAIPTASSITINRASTSGSAVYTSGGVVTGLLNDNRGWYGRIISQLGQSISSVYSDNRAKYQVLCGVQTAGTTSNHDECLKATQYKIEGGDYAYNWVTHIATAQYWSAGVTTIGGTSTIEPGLAFDYYITNTGNSAAQDANMVSFLSVNAISATSTAYGNFYTWANSFGPAIGMEGYEGGYSPDYLSANSSSPVTGASVTDGTHVALTLATTLAWSASNSIAGNFATVGMYLRVTSVGGMTQLNNNTYQVSGVVGNTVTIVVPDTTGFGAYTSGGSAEYYANNSGLTLLSVVNTFRYQSRYHSMITSLTTDNLTNFKNAGGTFPSHFLYTAKTSFSGGWVTTGQTWGIYDPDSYSTPTAALSAIQAYAG